MARFAVKLKNLHSALGEIVALDRELQDRRSSYSDLVKEVVEEWTSEEGFPEHYLIEWGEEVRLVQLKRNLNPQPGDSEYYVIIDDIEVVS